MEKEGLVAFEEGVSVLRIGIVKNVGDHLGSLVHQQILLVNLDGAKVGNQSLITLLH